MDGNYSLADIAAATGGNRDNDGMWGGDGAWWIIILFLFAQKQIIQGMVEGAIK